MILSLVQPDRLESATMQVVARLAIAGLVGLAVGVEREWSGHATGPNARFAGLRTFFLFGMLGGTAGLLLAWDYAVVAATLIVAGAGFVVASYAIAASRPGGDLDGTTEAAALVVLALGTLAGIGQMALAGGAVAVVVFALGEKARLHWLVRQVGETEMRAALQFAVLALVVLPVLPEGPYFPVVELRPRMLWGIVVLLSGLNFAGYLARRAIGASRGYGVTGMLGGIVSSTAVTLQFSRRSRDDEAGSVGAAEGVSALALGVIGACSVLPIRVVLVSGVLDGRIGQAMVPYLLPSAVVGFGIVAMGLRRSGPGKDEAPPVDGSPLRLRSAIQMALLFQAAITALSITRGYWGATGMTASAVLLGLTDVDALTVSMTKTAAGSPWMVALAAQSIAVGILSNTIFKLAVALGVGRGRFRVQAAAGLIVIAATIAGAILVIARASS